jgi:hypothetical protein
MKDRGMIVSWETDGVKQTGKVSQLDNYAKGPLTDLGKLQDKVIVRSATPEGGLKKLLVRVDKLTLIGFYD